MLSVSPCATSGALAQGHSPSEAFNETVEEATQSLYPLIGKNGMDWMYANCSTTAQRGMWLPGLSEPWLGHCFDPPELHCRGS